MVRKQFVIFILFVLALLSKNVLFHAYVFGAEWPANIGQYFCSQSGVVLLIASFVFLLRRPWWTLAVLAAVDIWVVTNWVYYQANGLFVSVSMLGMAGNLNGFTSSIGSFVDARLVWLLLPTLLYVVALCFYPRFEKRQVWPFAVTLLFGVGLVMCNNVLIHVDRSRQGYDDGALTWRQVLPLSINEKRMLIDWECEYSLVRDRSIIAYLPLHMVYEQTLKRFRDVSQETFTEDEKVLLGRLMHRDGEAPHPNSHLVLLLVESLESWVLEYEGVTPHINALRHGRPVLYADKVFSQARHGVSGDGQLTVNTGLLPIQSGAACILYGANTYPGIAHLYPRSAVVNPSKGTWNKHVTMPAYGYRELIEPDLSSERADWTDAEVCGKAMEWLMASDELSCVHPLTISSHSPFDRVSGTMAGLYEDTPEEMRRYLTCIHYADSCIGVLLDRLEAEGMMDKTTVVITGDHIFFHSDKRNSYVPFAEKHGLPISHWNYYVPLIIYSPQAQASVCVEEVCYQMDIYPTVLHAIDCASYAWKGLGVNLYEPLAVHQRTIGQNEAYILSDKLIRNNWFEHE